MAGQLGQVPRRAAGQDAAVDGRVQGLHAAAQDLRVAGDLLHRGDREPGRDQRPCAAAGRNQLEPQLVQPAGQLDQARLVVDAQNGTW